MGREVMSADYFIDHLLIPFASVDGVDERDAKLKYAADIVARVGEGENFLEVRTAARQANVFPVESTDFGWRKAENLPNLFSTIVEDMEQGAVEGPIEAGNGYHVIFLAGKRGGTEQIVHLVYRCVTLHMKHTIGQGGIQQGHAHCVTIQFAGQFGIDQANRRGRAGGGRDQ